MRRYTLFAVLLSIPGFIFFQNCGRSLQSDDPSGNSLSSPSSSPSVSPSSLSFALMDPTDGAAQYAAYLQKDTVDGIAIRLSWSTLQSNNESSYDWSKIDEAFTSALSYSKKVTLHILSAVYGTTPNWVYSAGAQSYTYTKPGGGPAKTDPIPWDSTYLSKWSAFLTALRTHLDAQGYASSLTYISVGAPVPEMSLVGCISNDLNGATTGVVSYSRASYLSAWKSVVLAMHNAFPTTKKLLPAPVAHICFADNDGAAFYKEVFDYSKTLSQTYFVHYATDLKATGSGSQRFDQIATILTQAPTALQYTWSYTDDSGVKLGGTLAGATCDKGIKTLLGTYFEVYKSDLSSSDSAVQNAVKAIHEYSLCP